jgi:hypothetical protein
MIGRIGPPHIPGNCLNHTSFWSPTYEFFIHDHNKNEPKKTVSAFFWDLALVFFSLIILMSVFELTKQLLNPSIWGSHDITIILPAPFPLSLCSFPSDAHIVNSRMPGSTLTPAGR